MRVPPMPCIAHRVPECPACKAGNEARRDREPVAWRFKERINGEFDSDWILTKYEPADGVRIIAREPLYTASGVPASGEPERLEPHSPPGLHLASSFYGFLRRHAHSLKDPTRGAVEQAAELIDLQRREIERLVRELANHSGVPGIGGQTVSPADADSKTQAVKDKP